MNNENFDLVTNDENEEFTVEFGEVINDGGTHDYNELDNQPQINGHTLEGNKTGEQLDLQDKINDLDTIRSGATKGATAVQPEDLARIATTGSYNDSLDKPSINNVALIGNISLDALGIQPKGNYALESEIPDVSNFITNTVDNLVNYYKKSETFTKQEVNDLISAITTMDIQVVQTLPTEDISTTTIYFVPKTTAGTNDAYDEYMYVSNSWEHIGSTDIDLSGYQTKIDSSHKLSSDLVDDANQTNKFVTTSEKQTWNNKYDKPNSGIPKTDLASAVQTSLGKADTAIQEHQDISGKVDKVTGKGLSTNDFTDTYKNNVDSNTSARHSHSNKTVLDGISSTDVTNWNNKGTYSKPSGGIPKTDLASDIQDELDIVNKVTVKTRNYFNLETDIILGKNGTGQAVSTRAVTVAINTGGGKSTVSVKTLPSNLKYQVWGYTDDNFTSPTNYTTSWIETKGTSTVVTKAYVRVLFGTVNNANITMQDFKGLEMQIEAGSTATDYSPSSTAIDYIARNTTYPVHLKICSYNVGMYSNGISTDTPPANATQHISDFLSENNFDILGVQEGRTNVNGQNIDNTLYKDYFMSQMNTTNLCAIKSQFTLSDTGSGTFTQGSRPYNYGTVRIGNKNVFVINVHLGLTAEQRVSNYTELLAILAQHEYFIAFGDFNAAIDYNKGVDEQTQTEFNNLINAGYTVANGGRWGLLNTMNTTTKHPDNICVSNNIKMISAKVPNIGSTMDSDHLPVIVEIVV